MNRARVRALLLRLHLEASRSKPYLSRRYPYRGRRGMLAALGSDLARTVTWQASDEPVSGDLAELLAKTDTAHKWSQYLPVYESVLGPLRQRPIRMLEIGVSRGGSLEIWRQYLHPESTIVGIDIDPPCRQFDDPARNVHVRIGSQADTAFLDEIIGEFGTFDVILDDGSHRNAHIIASFRHLFPNALATPGVYLVEDIHANYWLEFRDQKMSFVDFTKHLLDAMHAQYHVTNTELQFQVGHPSRLSQIDVPAITPTIDSIEFHDSIAVIRKSARALPRSIHEH